MTTKSCRLKVFREKNRIKLVELAQKSGLHYSMLSLIENEWRPLKKSEASALIEAYKKLGIDAKATVLAQIAA